MEVKEEAEAAGFDGCFILFLAIVGILTVLITIFPKKL
jgi:hypothetical protein